MAVVSDVYRVFSFDRLESKTPAGEYRSLNRAIAHAETVTYKMVVLNWRDEIVYSNQDN